MLSYFLSVLHRAYSLAAVQGSSSSADQPEHGASERGEGPPGVDPDQQSEALAWTGFVKGEPDSWEDTELAGRAAGESRSGHWAATREEEPGLGSCPYPAAQ